MQRELPWKGRDTVVVPEDGTFLQKVLLDHHPLYQTECRHLALPRFSQVHRGAECMSSTCIACSSVPATKLGVLGLLAMPYSNPEPGWLDARLGGLGDRGWIHGGWKVGGWG